MKFSDFSDHLNEFVRGISCLDAMCGNTSMKIKAQLDPKFFIIRSLSACSRPIKFL